jgi:transcriptional regulator with XRE-family HTH domain
MTESEATPTTREYLGAELSRLRRLAGISGRDLAARIGISQPKVSRIETGAGVPTLPEVHAWVAEVGADEDTRERLVRLTEAAYTTSQPWRSALRGGRSHLQDDVRAIETTARTVRVCQTSVIPGLLQTAEYARRLFPLVTAGMSAHDHAAAVSGRLRRQEALYDEAKRFEFLITEAALRWTPGGPPAVIAAQLARLESVATLPNVWVGLLPFDTPTRPWDSFVIFDDRDDEQDPIVDLELLHAELTVSDPRDVAVYREQYARWREVALTGDQGLGLLRRIAAEGRPT